MYYVYVIESKLNGKYYIGSTDNLVRRLTEHNNGLSKYTKRYLPWILRYNEEICELSRARKRERERIEIIEKKSAT